ncbi:MAG: DUF853 family protein [Cyclobacteriaceae bacterium]|nr:DUF853 family protein [Cyclobacteriaceae bacterium]
MPDFQNSIATSYTFKGASVLLGGAIHDLNPIEGLQIRVPLKTLNRHGLIAGATGTGKTKSLQVLLEELSLAGVPSLVMDIKGDLSGIGAPGTRNPIVTRREASIQMQWKEMGFPVEFLTISEEPGARIRSTVSEFGPVIMGKILNLNDTQEGVLGMLFKFADDHKLPLLNLEDLKSLLRYSVEDGKADIQKEYGLVSSPSVHSILRNVTALEQQGAQRLFGEPSFDVMDLCATDRYGHGMVNIIRLTDIQSKPQLFSAFMLSLLAEVFEVFPEAGDSVAPKLMIFIDEAHLLFREASKDLLNQIDIIIKLIRSKGIGIIFITQTPDDIPENILGQLGFKLQHALRAFTAKDRKAINLLADNFPETSFYDTKKLLTEMGIGEALVTVLNEKGMPTELAHTLMRPPFSRMDVLTDQEISNILGFSRLCSKYNQELDRHSAHEMLMERINEATAEKELTQTGKNSKMKRPVPPPSADVSFEKIMKSPLANTIARELTRGILGVFGISTSRRRRR